MGSSKNDFYFELRFQMRKLDHVCPFYKVKQDKFELSFSSFYFSEYHFKNHKTKSVMNVRIFGL